MRISTTIWAIAFSTLLTAQPAVRGDSVSLDTLDLANVQQDWGKAQANKTVDGHTLQINGQKFEHGIGTHVNSELSIDLDGATGRFTASAGIDDEAGGRFSEATFDVSADGKSLWSKTIKADQPAEKIDVPTPGRQDPHAQRDAPTASTSATSTGSTPGWK